MDTCRPSGHGQVQVQLHPEIKGRGKENIPEEKAHAVQCVGGTASGGYAVVHTGAVAEQQLALFSRDYGCELF